MREHRYSFEVDATPDEVWSVLHSRPRRPAEPGQPRVIEHGDVRIEIWFEGDENGAGLVRTCQFRVPKLLLSGGRARSWECITDSRPSEYSRYRAVGKPLWSEATGSHTLTDVGGGRTRIDFTETYHAFNPVLRVLLERYVHDFISKDNDRVMREAIEQGVAYQRRRRAEADVSGDEAPAAEST
jgi:hypothetical protein